MHRWVLVAILLVVWSSTALGEESNPGTITVFGAAEKYVEPDQVLWKLGLTARDKDIDKAVEAVEVTRAAIMAILGELAVADSNIALGPVRSSTQYKYDDNGSTSRLAYYEQNQNINVLQANMEEYDQFRLKFTSVAGLSVRQQFLSSTMGSAIEDVRKDAIVEARRKAEALAGALDQRVGRAISISEFKPNSTQRDLEDALSRQREVVDSRGEPEGINVTYRIYGVFELH